MTPRPAWLAAAGALLAAGCLLLINLLAQRFPLRLDASQGGIYSLSPGSRRVLRELKGPLEARVFFSAELPPQYAAARAYLRDLLDEYRQASAGRLSVRALDVDKDPAAREEALGEGVAPVQFNVVSQGKYEVREGLMGLVLRREDKKEVLPVVLQAGGLEYELTSRILRLSGRKRPVIGMVSSHGALAPEALPATAREGLERRYEVRPVDLGSLRPGATVPADIAALLVLGPSRRLPEPALYALDQYLMSGRPLFIAADTRRADLQAFVAGVNDSGLPAFLRRYGVSLGPAFVLDAQNQPVQVTQSRGIFSMTNIIPYPLFPIATDLDGGHPVTRHLESLSMPFAAPLYASTASVRGSWRPLVRSSPHSWLRAAWSRGLVHPISPLQRLAPGDTDARGPFVLAGDLEGPFESTYSSPSAAGFLARSRPGARLLVVGTSGFARGDLPAGDTGPAFLLNAVDWMALDEDLIAIRSKEVAHRPLREVPAGAKAALSWVCVLLPSALLMAGGGIRLRARRSASARRARAILP